MSITEQTYSNGSLIRTQLDCWILKEPICVEKEIKAFRKEIKAL